MLPVNRLDILEAQEDVLKMEKVLSSRESLLIFPEGTFSYAAGIRPFKAGAFKIALDQRVPIVPLAINGLRRVLPDERWLIKPGKVRFSILPPLFPQEGLSENTWDEVVRLRNQARLQIAKYSGEKTVDLVMAGVPSKSNKDDFIH